MSKHNATVLCGLLAIYGGAGFVFSLLAVGVLVDENRPSLLRRAAISALVCGAVAALAGMVALTIGVLGEWQ